MKLAPEMLDFLETKYSGENQARLSKGRINWFTTVLVDIEIARVPNMTDQQIKDAFAVRMSLYLNKIEDSPGISGTIAGSGFGRLLDSYGGLTDKAVALARDIAHCLIYKQVPPSPA